MYIFLFIHAYAFIFIALPHICCVVQVQLLLGGGLLVFQGWLCVPGMSFVISAHGRQLRIAICSFNGTSLMYFRIAPCQWKLGSVLNQDGQRLGGWWKRELAFGNVFCVFFLRQENAPSAHAESFRQTTRACGVLVKPK